MPLYLLPKTTDKHKNFQRFFSRYSKDCTLITVTMRGRDRRAPTTITGGLTSIPCLFCPQWVRTSHASFRQVPGLKPAGTSFSRNPVFLDRTTNAKGWIPAQKHRRNDETDERLSFRTNGVCTRLTSGGAAEWCVLDGLGSNLESNLIAIAYASEEMSREIRELGIEP